MLPLADSDSVDTAATSSPSGDTSTSPDSGSDPDSDTDTGTLDTSGSSTAAGPCDYVTGLGGLMNTEVSFMLELEVDGRVRWVDRENTSFVARRPNEPGTYTVYFTVPYANTSYSSNIDTLAASYSELERTPFLYRFQLQDEGGAPVDAEASVRISGDAIASDREYMIAQAFFASTFGAPDPKTLRCVTATRIGPGQYQYDFDGEPLEPRTVDLWTLESSIRVRTNEATGLTIEIRDVSDLPVDADMFIHISSAR